MQQAFHLHSVSKNIKGSITLTGSKSISNRVLIIRSLCNRFFNITNLSDSDDTVTLEHILSSDSDVFDAHHAGTTFRFVTAYCALKGYAKTITGSERMQQRPIGILVEGLKALGAKITYLNKEGFPPIKIENDIEVKGGNISLDASVSSQFVTALLLIAPTLPDGLRIKLEGNIVSMPYINMTIAIMEYFGVNVVMENGEIIILPQTYIPKDYFVEADWSAASYYYAIAALSDSAEINIEGLLKDSVQGDAAIASLAHKYGVVTTYYHNSILISKNKIACPDHLELDCLETPDIVQTLAVIHAGLGITALYSGLQTLKIKETDRIAALQKELSKIGVFLSKLPTRMSKKKEDEYYLQEGKAYPQLLPAIDTYQDHRMAMAFAPLAILFPILIIEPMVVTKSYPWFWRDIKHLGIISTAYNS